MGEDGWVRTGLRMIHSEHTEGETDVGGRKRNGIMNTATEVRRWQ